MSCPFSRGPSRLHWGPFSPSHENALFLGKSVISFLGTPTGGRHQAGFCPFHHVSSGPVRFRLVPSGSVRFHHVPSETRTIASTEEISKFHPSQPPQSLWIWDPVCPSHPKSSHKKHLPLLPALGSSLTLQSCGPEPPKAPARPALAVVHLAGGRQRGHSFW